MAFLAALQAHLRDQSEVQIRVRRDGAQLDVTIIPRLVAVDGDTTDETLAQFHAALSRPFHLVIAQGDDPDAVLANVLTSVTTTQAATLDDLARYNAEVEAARTKVRDDAARKQAETAAKKAADAKTKTHTGKPVAPSKPAIEKASAPASDTTPPEPAAISDLFSTPSVAPPAAPAAIAACVSTLDDDTNSEDGNAHPSAEAASAYGDEEARHGE